MSNMLYACSMLYKSNLPLIVVFNKVDVTPSDFATAWMDDFESFQEALDGERDQSYMTSLNRSMGLVLDEFYRNLRHVSVSAATGEGIKELMEAIDEAAKEYDANYLPELQRRKEVADKRELQRQEKAMEKMMADMKVQSKQTGAAASE